MRREIFKKVFAIVMIAALLFSNLPFEIISQTLTAYRESRNIVDKFWDLRSDSNVIDNLDQIAQRLKTENVQAATAGQMKLYFHKEPSDKNETYNSLSFNPPEPGATTVVTTTTSTTNTNATPPTALCESSGNTGETFNKVSASSGTTGNRCMASFISPPVGQAITMSTGDTGAVAANISIVDSANSAGTVATNMYFYKWDGTTLTRFKTFTSATDPGTTVTNIAFAAAVPDANVSFAATDRVVAILSRNVTVAGSSTNTSIIFDSSAITVPSIILKYTAITPNKPSLSGAKDDDFTVGAATTACTTGGVAYNTKWTCLQGAAASTAGEFNNGNAAGTTGDSTDWFWLNNKRTATGAVASNFGVTPSNTFLYQSLNAGYGNGTVRTVVNTTMDYTIGATNPTTPFSHSGLVLWSSDTDFLEVQVYSDAAKGTANTAKVALFNQAGIVGSAVSINSTLSNGFYNRVWIGFQNTGGTYQAQYSTDGTTWNSVGTATAHAAFTRVGLNSLSKFSATVVSQHSGAFEWFQHTFAANTSPTVALNTPADLSSGTNTTPTLNFTGTDAESDAVEYNVQVDTTNSFNGHAISGPPTDPDSVWTSDPNAFDGSILTQATIAGSATGSASLNYLLGKGTTASSSGSAITQVRARAYISEPGAAPANLHFEIYTQALAEDLGGLTDNPNGIAFTGYTGYATLIAPVGGWSWSVLQALETKLWVAVNGSGSPGVYVVEIEVTAGSMNSYYFNSSRSASVPLLDKSSSVPDAGFTAGHPFASGVAKDFTVQAGDALAAGTYYWRVRATDPAGSNTYGAWSSIRSFTLTEPAPNITAAPTSGQIGSTITVSGTNFGATAGTITINNKIATVGSWSATSLTGVVIPGQEGAANITGKIQITRAGDAEVSNLYPAGNFTILSPSVSGSTPAIGTPGQTLSIEFSGVGIDTDTSVTFSNAGGGTWLYRRPIVITGSTAGAQTNYQVQVTLTSALGTPSYTNINADGSDLRFTNSTGTELPYWIETWSDGGTSTVWVKVDSIPASPSAATIYMGYGNTLATSSGNGVNTFEFFDGFENQTVGAEPAGWTVQKSGTCVACYAQIYDSTSVKLYADGVGNETGTTIRRNYVWPQNYVYETRIFNPNEDSNGYPFNIIDGQNARYVGAFIERSGWEAPGNVHINADTYAIGWNNWHTYAVRAIGNTADFYVDGTLRFASRSISNAGPITNEITHNHARYMAPGYYLIDYSLVRKYVSAEPSVAAPGVQSNIAVSPILKLTKTGQTDIVGTSYTKVTDYGAVSASFNLIGSADSDGVNLSNVKQVSSGGAHTCAVSNAGNVYCWGRNAKGQLGNASVVPVTTPVQVQDGVATGVDSDGTNLINIKQISAGTEHTCALSNSGKVYCWGYGWGGQLGNADTIDQTTPVQVQDGVAIGVDSDGTNLINIKQISTGTLHTCAVSNSGNVYCWGDSNSGQLGDNTTTLQQPTPVQVQDGVAVSPDGDGTNLINIKQVSCGDVHTCAVSNSGNVYCWGDGSYGELGDSTNTAVQTTPVRVQDGVAVSPDGDGTNLINIKQIAAGGGLYNSSTCAVSNAGNAYCWGSGWAGELGNADITDQVTPVRVQDGTATGADSDGINLINIGEIGVGDSIACAYSLAGNAYCWGNGSNGQNGDGTITAPQTTPAKVQDGVAVSPDSDGTYLLNIKQIAVGMVHACAASNAGKVYCWGSGGSGGFGDGTTPITQTTPVQTQDGVASTLGQGNAAAGWWNLVIVNSDGQSGFYGNGTSTGFYITELAPTVTGINPASGVNTGIAGITSVSGTNFQSGATVKLTKTSQLDIAASTAFTFTNSTTLSSGAFDLTSKTLGWWNVVVTNPDAQSASYGNETSSGFEIISAAPVSSANIYQFETNTDTAQPPTTNIAVGGGIGGQTNIYFRMDMEGGLTGELYYPQVELKPVGGAFECNNTSPSPCSVTTGYFAEGIGVMYNGTAVKGWVNVTSIADGSYHWQVRMRNSAGTSDWASFGGNSDPSGLDIYMDNVNPVISLGTDGTCTTASASATDSTVIIKWSTSDAASGAVTPPGSGAYATTQVQYVKTGLFTSWALTPGTLNTISARENSPHQVLLSGLAPGTAYTYRVRSKDGAGNEAISTPDCTFSTSSSRPFKTIELFIGQESAQNTGSAISKNFSIYIPESPSAAILIKSAFIEIAGVTSATASQVINVGLLRGTQAIGPAGVNYTVDSVGANASFTILFDALNPAGTGQESMSDIISGAASYDYTLFLNGTATPVSAFSAKLILTYSFVP